MGENKWQLGGDGKRTFLLPHPLGRKLNFSLAVRFPPPWPHFYCQRVHGVCLPCWGRGLAGGGGSLLPAAGTRELTSCSSWRRWVITGPASPRSVCTGVIITMQRGRGEFVCPVLRAAVWRCTVPASASYVQTAGHGCHTRALLVVLDKRSKVNWDRSFCLVVGGRRKESSANFVEQVSWWDRLLIPMPVGPCLNYRGEPKSGNRRPLIAMHFFGGSYGRSSDFLSVAGFSRGVRAQTIMQLPNLTGNPFFFFPSIHSTSFPPIPTVCSNASGG